MHTSKAKKFNIFTSVLWHICLVAASVYFIYLLAKPVTNALDIVELHGNKQISNYDLLEEISKHKIENKSFFEINPLSISKKLQKHPLISDITIRRRLFPKLCLQVFINETQPWAIYEDQIVNSEGYIIARLNDKDLDLKVKGYLQSIRYKLVKIKSYALLKAEQLFLLRSLANTIEKATKEEVSWISGSRDENYLISTKEHKYKIGMLNKKTKKRVNRVKLVLDQIFALEDKLDYVDLSLSTPEVILGKKIE